MSGVAVNQVADGRGRTEPVGFLFRPGDEVFIVAIPVSPQLIADKGCPAGHVAEHVAGEAERAIASQVASRIAEVRGP